mgnify:CR=1 FL=1
MIQQNIRLTKKRLSHLLDINNVIDVNLMNYMRHGVPLDLEDVSTNAHDFLSMKFFRKENINTLFQ